MSGVALQRTVDIRINISLFTLAQLAHCRLLNFRTFFLYFIDLPTRTDQYELYIYVHVGLYIPQLLHTRVQNELYVSGKVRELE